MIGAPANQIFTLLAKAQVKSYADPKGKLIATASPRKTISIARRMLLEKHGLKVGRFQDR